MSETEELPILKNGSEDADHILILAHGAGAPMDTDFMNYFAQKLAGPHLQVIRFEFPYMALRRQGHGKRPPNTQKILLESWRQMVRRFNPRGKIFIGGKSMGGRMASMIADEMDVAGLLGLGYPFYAPGKMDKPRTAHLQELKTPTLILQGQRDPMGSQEVVAGYSLSPALSIEWLADGNHDLKPRVRSGLTHEQNLQQAADAITAFITRNS